VLQSRWDRTCSEHSHGFRPGRSAHQAVQKAQQYIAEGFRWVVDIDLEKCFDRVNPDQLMGRVAERVRDKRMLKLIRAFLEAGVLEEGLVSPIDEGTPQGGPLSPLLSNLVLDQLDRMLEGRGHRFARYAEDGNIYVRSGRAGERVLASVSRFVTGKLKGKVNSEKSAVARPWDRKFLGFSFSRDRQHEPDTRDQSTGHDQGAESRPSGLARLLRAVPDAFGAGRLGQGDSAQIAECDLEAVATIPEALPTIAPAGSGATTSVPNGEE
jgi:RNA-directed DNA polymerase